MIKTRKIKVKSIENEEIIMAMTMTKTIITKIIILIIIMLLSYLYFCLKFVFALIKLLKRREIFVISNKLCVFF